MRIAVPLTPGEVLDRISILELKSKRAATHESRTAASHEWFVLTNYYDTAVSDTVLDEPDLVTRIALLAAINERLWVEEDNIRVAIARDDSLLFVAGAARAIIRLNDERAKIKRELNELHGIAVDPDTKAYEVNKDADE